MTKDEAIKIIEDAAWWYWQGHCHGLTQAEIFEARDMAISALERKPSDNATLKEIFCMDCEYKEQQPCEDAVSREAVLGCLKASKLKKFDFILDAREQVELLPSVNVQRNSNADEKHVENTLDAVSRDEVKELIKSGVSTDTYDDVEQVCKWIDALPSVTQKSGEWIEFDNSHCECPFCHKEWSYFENMTEWFNFCPNCGADMKGEGK